MDDDYKNTAKKGANGDKEAALTIVLMSPEGHYKKGMDPEKYAKKMDESEGDEEYGDYDMEEGDEMEDQEVLENIESLIAEASDPAAAAKAVYAYYQEMD